MIDISFKFKSITVMRYDNQRNRTQCYPPTLAVHTWFFCSNNKLTTTI
jgi:hypothetical protein